MKKPSIAIIARLAPVMALFSCTAPKAIVIESPPQPKKEVAAVEPEVSEPAIPALPDDKIRMPDMETMPSDNEFRATNPSLPTANSDSGAVIARPPTDPPSRPKPKEPE